MSTGSGTAQGRHPLAHTGSHTRRARQDPPRDWLHELRRGTQHSRGPGGSRFPFCVVPSGRRMFSARHSVTRQVLHQSRGWRLPEQVGKA